jgi:glycosyltransferase involved in cell wall biosynthesis
MAVIHIMTQAYNAQDTIGRAIESVLAQTYADFRYYILDSASTDGTWEIINKYARRDSRIIPLRNSFNRFSAYTDRIPMIIENAGEDGIFAMLDADDVYYPDAFERLYAFMEKYGLDIAVGGYDVFLAEEDRQNRHIFTDEAAVYRREDYAMYFPRYYSRIRTVWGKLISARVLKNCDFSKARDIVWGVDTMLVLEAIKNSNSFGIMPDAVYNYYVHPESVSYKFMEHRVMDGKRCFEMACSFLSTFGEVSAHNRKYLLMVYYSMLKNSLDLMNASGCDIREKYAHIKNILSDPLTEEAFLMTEISNADRFELIKKLLA